MDDKSIEKAASEIMEVLKKNFSTARKLTEGDNAFQQYAMENKDRVGSSTPPIDIQEPPVHLDKASISTMAPKENIGENGADKAIEYDQPVDKVKKDYSRHGLGAFSTQHQIPGEMSNQVSAPEEVNPKVESEKRNLVTNNKEAFFEKDLDDDEFYKAIDDLIFEEERADFQKSYSIAGDASLEVKSLAEKLEKEISSSLIKTVNSWANGIDKSTDADDALVSLKKSLLKWNSTIAKSSMSGLNDLADLGIWAGIRKSRIPVSEDFRNSISIASYGNNGMSSVLRYCADDVFSTASSIVKSYKMGSYKQKRAIDSRFKDIRSMVKMMLKQETAEFANLGMQKTIASNFK